MKPGSARRISSHAIWARAWHAPACAPRPAPNLGLYLRRDLSREGEAAGLVMPWCDTRRHGGAPHRDQCRRRSRRPCGADRRSGRLARLTASWRYPTTSPCSNSRPIPLNSTRWKMCGLICVPTSSPYPSSTIMSRSSTGVAKHGTSLPKNDEIRQRSLIRTHAPICADEGMIFHGWSIPTAPRFDSRGFPRARVI